MASIVVTQPCGGFHINLYADHRSIATSNMSHNQYHVPANKRSLYGMEGIVVYASSHPLHASCLEDPPMSTWAPIKSLFAIGADNGDAEFTAFYETVHDQIVASILATLPDANWGLNVLRLGFDTERLNNPYTIHLVVAPDGGLSDQIACKIVAQILTVIAADPNFSQSVHIDVCRAKQSSSSSARSSPRSFSLLNMNPEVYDSSARLPYSSVGLSQSNFVGTLSGYIQHRDKDGRDTVYALTCRHVIDPHSGLVNAGPITPALLPVTCPATNDHKATIQTITDSVIINALPSERTTLGNTLRNAEEYNINFGDVYATSGTGRLLPNFQGRSDWAIISITNPDVIAENKHVRSSRLFVSFNHGVVDPLNPFFVRDATQYFHPGPHFKPIRDINLEPNEIVFKPRSRTTNTWTGGTFNGIRSTQKGAGMVTRECCFIALPPTKAMSSGGDSGSIIVDKEFHPVALLWGGDDHEFAHGPKDVTYGSPLSKVIQDIENCMRWTEGSVSLV